MKKLMMLLCLLSPQLFAGTIQLATAEGEIEYYLDCKIEYQKHSNYYDNAEYHLTCPTIPNTVMNGWPDADNSLIWFNYQSRLVCNLFEGEFGDNNEAFWMFIICVPPNEIFKNGFEP